MQQSFAYRLYPSRCQERGLESILTTTRLFYNSLLAERKDAWEERRETVTKAAQLRRVKEHKATNPYAATTHSHILQVVATDLDKGFQSFFRRVKAGEVPGYPRFRGANRWCSFGLKEYGNGFSLDGRRLKVHGVGRIAVRWHRPIEGEIKTVRITKKAGHWYAAFSCVVPDKKPLPATGKSIGLDVGLTHLLTTSAGEQVSNPRWYRTQRAKLRVIQRRIARRTKGGSNRKKAIRQVQRQHEIIANRRKDYLHKLVYDLVQDYDIIAVEKLAISNMARNRHLALGIMDAGWGLFASHLLFKAACAGRRASAGNPAYTSRTCSGCGDRFSQEIRLSVRWVTCQACGLSLDRDHNAARNVLARALQQDPARREPLGANVAGLPACVAQEAVAL